MKVTVNRDEEVYRQNTVTAARRGVTVTSILESALLRYLEDLDRPAVIDRTFVLPTVDGRGGLLPGVDLANGAELHRLLEFDIQEGQLPGPPVAHPFE